MLVYKRPRQFKHISRYSPYSQIVDNVDNVTYLESFNVTKISDSNATYHVVDASEENRLDIISWRYYQTPSLYWFIAMANDLINPMVVSQGTVLKIPSYESLFSNGGPLLP